MKQRIYTAILALSAFILLALPLLPHHHHQGVWCDVVEHCAQDDAANDRHTSHRGDGSTCLETVSYTVAKANIAKQSIEAHRLHFTLLLPLLADIFSSDVRPQDLSQRFAPVVPCYAADVVRAIGRRGPPTVDGLA